MTARSEKHSPPTGTVTFLFTDLVGSTELWDQNPKAMTEALAWHDEALRRAIADNEGYIFATAGDGFGAAFADPMQGAAAAVAAQQMVGSREWEGLGVLRVRMGLDTGIAEERDGDYFGPPVNRASRIMALAEGGEVLTSHTFSDLLGHHLEEGIRLVDVGERQLKGMARPQMIFAVEYGPPLEEKVALPRWVTLIGAGVAGLLAIGALLLLVGPFGASDPEGGEETPSLVEPAAAPAPDLPADEEPADLATGVLAPEHVCPDGLTRPESVDFSFNDLSGAVLECLDLSGAVFEGTSLAATQFIGVDLSGAHFTDPGLTHIPPDPPVWRAVRVDDVRITGGAFHVRVQNSDVRGLEIGPTNLSVELVHSVADGVDFSLGTDLKVVNFNGGSARGANLAGLAITSYQTNLEEANLSRALVGHMMGSSLVNADLSGARLGGTSFEGEPYQADFSDADLSGAVVTGVVTEQEVQWGNTICPDGSTSNENLGRCDLG